MKWTLSNTKKLSKPMLESTWNAFLEGGTNHSADAQTLEYVMNRCEEEGVPFKLSGLPGVGYFIEGITDDHF